MKIVDRLMELTDSPTVQSLADKLEMERSRVSKYRNNEDVIQMKMLREWCDKLNIKFEIVFSEKKN